MKSLLKYLSPFAPDHSGAVSVFFEFGGLIVLCDAGGCTGNVCGFDEPRWFSRKCALFSAGLRDMDAILGRDERLVAKVADAVDGTDLAFIAYIGTPVPAIIATDFSALKRMTQKRTNVPVLAVESVGTSGYDRGEALAYLELFRAIAVEKFPIRPGSVGVLGVTPLDFSRLDAGEAVAETLRRRGASDVFCYGMGAGLDAVRNVSAVEKLLVTSPAAWPVAEILRERFGTPLEVGYPLLPESLTARRKELVGKKVLIIHQQVAANSLREAILRDVSADVAVASWFQTRDEWKRPGDFSLTDEDSFTETLERGDYDVVIADIHLKRAAGSVRADFWDFPHFAVSGRYGEIKNEN